MELSEKLKILADSAKYDVSCSSSGSKRSNLKNGIGNTCVSGICHSFGADGRCFSLLKILFSNCCIYDCKYCINRCTNSIPRATFTPKEVADLTIQFYKRNYIEGLFLSSAVIGSPDHTMELLYETVSLLRNQYDFHGYIHTKTIPGSSPTLIQQLGLLVDRMSINIELPSCQSLKLLAPQKEKAGILAPMNYISTHIAESQHETSSYAKRFVPAGQTTQLIVGASPESDLKILQLSEGLYQKFHLKRIYYSAYISINQDSHLPTLERPPLLRENRLYQADWLIRNYGFKTNELLDETHPNFNSLLDPKCDWALRHLDYFPIEVNSAEFSTLLRVPGIGVISAKRIIRARKNGSLNLEILKGLGIVLKRAIYFITCSGKYFAPANRFRASFIEENLLTQEKHFFSPSNEYTQLSLFQTQSPTKEDHVKCLTGIL